MNIESLACIAIILIPLIGMIMLGFMLGRSTAEGTQQPETGFLRQGEQITGSQEKSNPISAEHIKEEQIDTNIEELVRNLEKYNSVLEMLVQSLESHSGRWAINDYLQKLIKFDLGAMVIPIYAVTNSESLQCLQKILMKINSGANAVGKHLKGETGQPTNLQDIVNRAYEAEKQDALPSALYTLTPNILMVTDSALGHIKKQINPRAG